ncbi:alkaline phosphatase family protein [Nocardiopsis gilva]|uniref:alkaline phosphatase family protein n=1 Tax=Nocardiopsis gilva TaxID=280236 RepID=UPI00034C38AB|nr:alkaline phosphatase family protein [Nocardiopsis gilva]
MRRRSFLSRGAASAVGVPALAAMTPLVTPRPAAARAVLQPPVAGLVVLIDWDGVDPTYLDAYLHDRLPRLRSLADRGSLATAACTYKTVSNPSRSGTATGARPIVHGNVAYVLDPRTGKAIGQTRDIAAETIAQSLRRQYRNVLSAGWYIVQDKGASYGNPEGLYTQGVTWEENVETVVRALRGEPVDSNGIPVTLPRIPDFVAAYSADIDSLGHREGPNSPNIPRRLAELDTGLGRIIDVVEEVGLGEDATFVLVSDHGMTGYTKSLEPQVLGAISDAGFTVERLYSGQAPAARTEVVLTASPRAANVYLRGRADTARQRDRIERLLRDVPELEGVYNRDELDAMGAAPAEGDFAVDARPPYAFFNPDEVDGRERGGHASLREGTAPLVLAGAGVRQGDMPHDPRTIDIAPTISHLLGVEPPADAEGRVLTEALAPRVTY